jgi:hypothetical protein
MPHNNHTGSDLMNEEAKIIHLLFCHQKHSANNIQNCLQCELLHCLAGERRKKERKNTHTHQYCHSWTGLAKMMSVLVYGFRRHLQSSTNVVQFFLSMLCVFY